MGLGGLGLGGLLRRCWCSSFLVVYVESWIFDSGGSGREGMRLVAMYIALCYLTI